MLSKFKESRSGFTLVELLTSIFIIALISGVFMANYHVTNEKNKLDLAAQELASNIRLAQNYALGSKEFNGSIPVGGWGVEISYNDVIYKIFADLDNSMHSWGAPVDEDFQVIDLPNGMRINTNNCSGGLDYGMANIVFIPPDPETILWSDNDGLTNEICIDLNDVSGRIKTIKINKFGLIDIQ
ncbi:MAG: prepilin-type N-terminal cleavage/methylation domain-containing protein [Candidatus Falkowbacteria bacterium]